MAPPNSTSALRAASAPSSIPSCNLEVSAPMLQQPAAAQTDQLDDQFRRYESAVDMRAVSLALVLALAGCRSAAPPVTGSSQSLAPDAAAAAEAVLVGTYAGTLPCADCGGIRTRLTLYAKSRLQTGEGAFDLSEEYLTTRDANRRVDTRGRWILLRGTPTDVDATVYQLNIDGAERVVMFFLRVGDEALRLLDREQREIRSTANYTLARMTPPLGAYTLIDPAAAEVRAAAEYALSERAAQTGTALALRRVSRAERQVVAGLNFRLCLEVTISEKPEEVQVIVYRNLQQRFSLAQWSSTECGSR